MQHLVHHSSRFLLKTARTRSFSSNSIITSTLSDRLLVNDPHAPVHVEVNAHSRSVLLNRPTRSTFKWMETVDKCFSHDTVEEIIDVLDSEAAKTNDGWYGSILKKLKYASPLSLKVSLRSIREGRSKLLPLDYMLCSSNGDYVFRQGVRARMVDKDYAPKWDPPSLEHVSKDMVEQYFSPLSPFEHELELPARQQVATYK
ncbi:3-hydroxyisobutyryl-CoA hydrolase-like protein 1, mitochondrial [Tanacetum coccineum]